MAAPVVQIDGKNFVAVPQGRSERVVRRLRNQDFVSQFSGEGIRSPSTFLGYQTLIFPNFSLGLGRERIDSDSARVTGEYRRFWDATCDTRFASGTYLPILEEDSTSTGLEVIRASAPFKGDLWSVWEDNAGRTVVARQYDGDPTPPGRRAGRSSPRRRLTPPPAVPRPAPRPSRSLIRLTKMSLTWPL